MVLNFVMHLNKFIEGLSRDFGCLDGHEVRIVLPAKMYDIARRELAQFPGKSIFPCGVKCVVEQERIEDKNPKKFQRWVNLYSHNEVGELFYTKEEADYNADYGRIECRKIEWKNKE